MAELGFKLVTPGSAVRRDTDCAMDSGQGACNEYPQHMFLWRNKNILTFWLKKMSYLELCILELMSKACSR